MRGRVLAANGMPLRRAQVTVFAAAETGLSQRHGATTDGDGKWEITDLPAGRYTVSASKAGYVTIQYGQRRPFEQGTPVVVADAATVERLDVTLQRGAVIAGRILDEFGEPVAQIGVQAMRYRGEHAINARSARSTEGAEFANYTFKATGEPLTVRIVTSKGATLSGRVVWDGNASRGTTPVRVQVQQEVTQLTPFIGGSVPGADGTLNEDNTFKLAGEAGKGFIRVFPAPTGWTVKSVTVDGEDVTDVPIDLSSRRSIDDIRVVLTDKLTDLTGTVTDSRGTPLKDYVVILLPAGLKDGLSTRRFISMLRPDQDGSFRTKGMPPLHRDGARMGRAGPPVRSEFPGAAAKGGEDVHAGRRGADDDRSEAHRRTVGGC